MSFADQLKSLKGALSNREQAQAEEARRAQQEEAARQSKYSEGASESPHESFDHHHATRCNAHIILHPPWGSAAKEKARADVAKRLLDAGCVHILHMPLQSPFLFRLPDRISPHTRTPTAPLSVPRAYSSPCRNGRLRC